MATRPACGSAVTAARGLDGIPRQAFGQPDAEARPGPVQAEVAKRVGAGLGIRHRSVGAERGQVIMPVGSALLAQRDKGDAGGGIIRGAEGQRTHPTVDRQPQGAARGAGDDSLPLDRDLDGRAGRRRVFGDRADHARDPGGTSIFPCFPQFRAGLVARTRLEAACRDVRQRRQRPSRPASAASGRFGLRFAVRLAPGRG
jgi:hypothetical protein